MIGNRYLVPYHHDLKQLVSLELVLKQQVLVQLSTSAQITICYILLLTSLDAEGKQWSDSMNLVVQ